MTTENRPRMTATATPFYDAIMRLLRIPGGEIRTKLLKVPGGTALVLYFTNGEDNCGRAVPLQQFDPTENDPEELLVEQLAAIAEEVEEAMAEQTSLIETL